MKTHFQPRRDQIIAAIAEGGLTKSRKGRSSDGNYEHFDVGDSPLLEIQMRMMSTNMPKREVLLKDVITVWGRIAQMAVEKAECLMADGNRAHEDFDSAVGEEDGSARKIQRGRERHG
jgi:hypothetical protein